MERHILDRARASAAESNRLPRYLLHERDSRGRGPHHAINVLRRLPRGSGETGQRMRSYLQIDRQS